MKIVILGLIIIGSLNAFAGDCEIKIKSISVTPLGDSMIQDVTTTLTNKNSAAICEEKARKILKDEYPFGIKEDGTLLVVKSFFYSGKFKTYYFAEYTFDNYDYDFGLLSIKGRLQRDSAKMGKNKILDENENILLK